MQYSNRPLSPRQSDGIARVLVADGETPSRERVRSLLEQREHVEVIGECQTGLQAVRAIEADPPDLVFLDVVLPELPSRRRRNNGGRTPGGKAHDRHPARRRPTLLGKPGVRARPGSQTDLAQAPVGGNPGTGYPHGGDELGYRCQSRSVGREDTCRRWCREGNRADLSVYERLGMSELPSVADVGAPPRQGMKPRFAGRPNRWPRPRTRRDRGPRRVEPQWRLLAGSARDPARSCRERGSARNGGSGESGGALHVPRASTRRQPPPRLRGATRATPTRTARARTPP